MLANLETATHPDEIDSNILKQAFLDDFETTCNVYRSSKSLGIARITVYDKWLKNDEVFRRKFDEIRGNQIDGIEGNLLHEGLHNEKAITAQIFALKCWRPERYGDKYDISGTVTTLDLTGSANTTLEAANRALAAQRAINALAAQSPLIEVEVKV